MQSSIRDIRCIPTAPQLFDGTEIDEILSLRILTMTEQEKKEMRGAGVLARQILERTESLTPAQLMTMNGALRMPERKGGKS